MVGSNGRQPSCTILCGFVISPVNPRLFTSSSTSSAYTASKFATSRTKTKSVTASLHSVRTQREDTSEKRVSTPSKEESGEHHRHRDGGEIADRRVVQVLTRNMISGFTVTTTHHVFCLIPTTVGIERHEYRTQCSTKQ